jgi:hypothetical protein
VNARELEQRLLEAGCNPINFSIGGGGSDVYCLANRNGTWRVFYTERGRDDDPIFESTSEEEACEFYFDYIARRIRHDHLVGLFVSEENAQMLSERLAQHGIRSHRDKIPYGGWVDRRFRVFVVGKDIFTAREILGELPVREQT